MNFSGAFIVYFMSKILKGIKSLDDVTRKTYANEK